MCGLTLPRAAAPPEVLVAAAYVEDGDQVLIVRGVDSGDPSRTYWSLPAGVVESGELLHEALARELREETSLVAEGLGEVLYVVCAELTEGHRTVVIVQRVERWSGALHVADPDGQVHEAAFVARPEAIARAAAIPWPAMRDPLVACLSAGRPPASLWCYRG
ncbi:MAG TPA: NUDIX hydrolase [Acidimicrobiia bacterium]|nr:NUDIX hydrolase [Acidimicrobiia bacterium]